MVLPVEPRRRAGLEPPERETGAAQRLRQPERRRLAGAPGGDLFGADMDEPAEERAGGQHHPAGGDLAPIAEAKPGDSAAFVEQQILDRALDDIETFGFGEQFRHRRAVELAVGLGARAPHRRSLAAVQHAELDAGAVDRAAHHPVERIDLAHQMALGQPADRRVARHLADRVAAMGDQGGTRAEPSRSGGGLAAGMTAADHDDIVFRASVVHGAGM